VDFSANQTSNTITVIPVDDNLAEPTETVVVTLNPGASYSVGSPNTATVNILDNDVPSNPVISLAFDGKLRDRVGQNNSAGAPDGQSDGTFTVTFSGGSRTLTTLQLSNSAGGVWNTSAADFFWTLGAANDLDSLLLNGSDDSVSFVLNNGGNFKIFAADFQNQEFLPGTAFTLTASFSDGSSASANVTLNGASIALAFDGKLRDRVGQNNLSRLPDGQSDGTFTVTLNGGSGNRAVTELTLSNSAGGVWNTTAADYFWTLGAAPALDAPLVNGSDDAVSIALTEGSSFKIFASDYQNQEFLPGTTFTLTVNFADGSTASANVTL
jgi:hypothetical protein